MYFDIKLCQDMILKIYAVYIINIKKDGQELVFVYVQLFH